MTVAAASSAETAQSFVLLRLAERRFALAASQVAELVAPSRIFRFPHKSPAIEGVILRRGRMIPVADIADRLNGKKLTTRRFFLLATRQFGTQLDWVAIPVSGECELVSTDMMEPGGNDSPHVAGWLSHGGEVIEVLRLSVLTPGPAEPAPVRMDPARDAESAFANASLKEALS
jgi:chemotaxis signal transduction protein